MNLLNGLLSEEWTVAAWLLFLPLVALAIWHGVVRGVVNASSAAKEINAVSMPVMMHFNVWLGSIVVLILLWSVQAGIKPGLSLHMLGASFMTLVFGPWLAFLGLCIVLAGVTLNSGGDWGIFAINALLMCALGPLLAHTILRLSERYLPQQLFVYIFANGFFGAALCIAAVGLTGPALLAVSGVYSVDYLLSEYLPYVFLLSFSEAWMTGMVLTLFVVYLPDWVESFEDWRYLHD